MPSGVAGDSSLPWCYIMTTGTNVWMIQRITVPSTHQQKFTSQQSVTSYCSMEHHYWHSSPDIHRSVKTMQMW